MKINSPVGHLITKKICWFTRTSLGKKRRLLEKEEKAERRVARDSLNTPSLSSPGDEFPVVKCMLLRKWLDLFHPHPKTVLPYSPGSLNSKSQLNIQPVKRAEGQGRLESGFLYPCLSKELTSIPQRKWTLRCLPPEGISSQSRLTKKIATTTRPQQLSIG